MIVYDGTKEDFLKSVENDTIALEIKKNIYTKMHRNTAKSEFRSWENSLEYMYKVLNDSNIPDNAGIAIEYNIPQTSKRVDFIISGYDAQLNSNVMIIELKQWDQIEAVMGEDALVETYIANGRRKVVHPSYQAWSYSMLIKDYNQAVQDGGIHLLPCAYLHNYRRSSKDDPLDSTQYEEYLRDAPAFTRGEVVKFREFIKKNIHSGDNKELLLAIDNGRIRPSKSLQNSISRMLKGNREFIMIDEQKVVYEEIMAVSQKCLEDGIKRTVIVQGGPGTGKTVVAVNLLAELTGRGQVAHYVSKNSAPRKVYLKKLKGEIRKSSVDNMFKSSGIYTEAGDGAVHTILVDEAHRLNEKSGMFQNQGENQIKEIIHAAVCSVFFIDESQRVTIKDIGSVQEIEKWAEHEGAEVIYRELKSQFRCDGSDGYLAWLDDVLEIHESANYDMEDINYDIRICDTPDEVRNIIIEKNAASNHARILAGYCWDWIKQGKNNSTVHDIKIGDFEMSWNLGNTTTYAIDETSVNEIGCIHTSQGLEFDYVGVIIGDDMRYENGRIVTDFTKRAKTDQSLKGIKKLYKENPQKADKIAEEIIKNTYRTLMTRGMKGCYVYCVDDNLGKYLKGRVKG
ncbi:MAG: DUF2075 domain-containing protein [Lachnospiraceae bacterium]|nr:DUF2075 domain-containing protein [Lachnospiraceae bacterium]